MLILEPCQLPFFPMRFISGVRHQLAAHLPSALGRYRQRIFIQRLGWPLACGPNRQQEEQDQFDQQETVYVIALNDEGQICGCARLLPTTQPTLMQEVFPHLMQDHLPRSRQIWELSRFASDGPTITRPLIEAVLRCAGELGVARLIALSPLAVERLLSRWGILNRRAGMPVQMSGQWVCARWIKVPTRHQRPVI